MGEFISESLAPHNLEAKQIAGKAVKSREMVDFFQRYLEIFNGDEIPEPKSIFNTTAEVTNLHALNSSREAYVERMEGLKLSATSEAIIETDLTRRHEENLTLSLQLFQVARLRDCKDLQRLSSGAVQVWRGGVCSAIPGGSLEGHPGKIRLLPEAQ